MKWTIVHYRQDGSAGRRKMRRLAAALCDPIPARQRIEDGVPRKR
jgi:hypothetical protein